MVMIGVDPNYEQRALGQFSAPPRAYEPGAFAGTGGVLADAPFRLASRIPMAIGMAASGLTWLADRDAGFAMFRQTEKLYGRAVDYWTPDARTTGTAAQVVGGVAEIVPALFLGPAAAPVIAGTTTASTGRDLVRSGVDGATAGAVAAAQGVAIAAGFAAPAAVGNTLAQRVASGAAINVATGAGGDAASAAVLEAGGYDKQAERFNPFDLTARGIDLLLGAAFGAAAHLGAPKDFDQQMRPADREAILAIANNDHLTNATGPGRPATPVDAGKQARNVTSAIEQLLDAGRVDAGQLPEGDIAFRPEPPLVEPGTMRAGVEDGLREAGALTGTDEIALVERSAREEAMLAVRAELLSEAGEADSRGAEKAVRAELREIDIGVARREAELEARAGDIFLADDTVQAMAARVQELRAALSDKANAGKKRSLRAELEDLAKRKEEVERRALEEAGMTEEELATLRARRERLQDAANRQSRAKRAEAMLDALDRGELPDAVRLRIDARAAEAVEKAIAMRIRMADIPRDVTADIVADVAAVSDTPGIVPDAAAVDAPAAARLADAPEVADTLAALEADPELAAFRIEDENGNQASLADVVRGAVAESEQAVALQPGFKAAAMCFLRSLA